MQALLAGALRIEVVDAAPPAPIALLFTGKSMERNPIGVLGPFFTEAIRVARERGCPLELHFEQLEAFNSSSISAVIQIVQQANRSGVKMILVYDGTLKWQKLSFDTLRILGRGNKLLELRRLGDAS